MSTFTYVATFAGFVYVAFAIDVFSRMIVGWRVARTMRTDLRLDAWTLRRVDMARCRHATPRHAVYGRLDGGASKRRWVSVHLDPLHRPPARRRRTGLRRHRRRRFKPLNRREPATVPARCLLPRRPLTAGRLRH